MISESMAVSQAPAEATGLWTWGPCHTVCLFTPQYQVILFGDTGTNVFQQLVASLNSATALTEPASQIQHRHHCATKPHFTE